MPPIYISYHTQDAAIVERIVQRILASFGKHALRMNPTLSCPENLKLDYHIESMMHSAETILIIIGNNWAGVDELGRFRPNSGDVPLYNELRQAMRSEREVIVLLIDGANMPPAKYLGEELLELYHLPVVHLRPESFEEDLAKFVPSPTLTEWIKYWFTGVWLKRRTLTKPDEAFFEE